MKTSISKTLPLYYITQFSGLLLALCLATAVSAQQTDDAKQDDDSQNSTDIIEEVIVTGIRKSLMDSIENKRVTVDIVDTISSEDMGKFPDVNIADSLQRITGVSIDREGGEGQLITIRGLGPEFNNILFNGRMLATETEGRSFSLDTLSTDNIRNINVYKTADAALTEGGIGGTVDIITAKPFDFDGFRAIGSARAIYTESSGKTEPQASFIVSDTFLDDRAGILFSFNHSKRTQTNRSVINFQNVPGDMVLEKGPFWTWTWGPDKKVVPDVTRAQSLDRDVMEETRERNTGTLVFQFQANDDMLITADALYSEFDVKAEGYTANTWFWYPTGDYPDAEGGKDPILDNDTDRNVLFFQHGDTSSASAFRDSSRPSQVASLGLNFDWAISDDLSLNADAFWSNAKRRDRGYSRQILIETGGFGYAEYDYQNGGDYPVLNLPPEGIPSEDNIDIEFPAHYEAAGNYIDAENIGLKLDFAWQADMGAFTGLDFGAHYADNSKDNQRYQVDEVSGRIYKNYAKHGDVRLYVPPELLELGQLDGGWTGITDFVHRFNTVDDYIAWLQDPATLELLNAHPSVSDAVAMFYDNGGFVPKRSDNSFLVTEKITSLYASANFDFNLGNMPMTVILGGRYTTTDLSSEGTIQKLIDLVPGIPSEDEPNAHLKLEKIFAADGDFVYTKEKTSYSNFLPSLMTNLNITDDVIFRAGVSQTLTRPTFENVGPQLTYGETHVINGNYAQGANPQLKPYVSTNFDLSLEWYYGAASMVSLAYFKKDVDDWIVREESIEEFELETSPYTEFTVLRPRNIENAEIDGIEFNWIHTFESGFGFTANYTHISSNAELGTESSFALEGLGDSANFVPFWEKGPWQVRIAWNWRDEFLQSTFVGWTGTPQFVGEYQQTDARVSYAFNDRWSVFVEGINITDEATSKYGRHENQFLQFLEHGSRYAIGVHGSF